MAQIDYKRWQNLILLACLGLSLVLHLGLYYANPRPTKEREIVRDRIVNIEIVEVPPTQQEQEPPPPMRPQVPIEADDDMEIEDVTIMDTDLDDLAMLEAPDMIAPEIEEDDPIVEYWAVEELPTVVHQVVPVYPEIARQAGMEGRVFVRILVGKDGAVQQVVVDQGPQIFHQSTIDASWKMRFTPGMQNGRAVRVWVTKPFRFQLN